MSGHLPDKDVDHPPKMDGNVHELTRVLDERTSHIVEAWYMLLPARCVAFLGEEAIRERLTQWASQLITLLLAEQWEPSAAQAVGRQLASLPSVEVELLGHSQAMLIEQLMTGLSAMQRSYLWPPLTRLLIDIATGFVKELQQAILTDQEKLRLSLLRSQQRSVAARKVAEAELAAARRRLTGVREAERLAMAQVIHDEAIQQLLALCYQVAEVQDALEEQGVALKGREGRPTLYDIRRAMLQVVDYLRGTLRELRPPALDVLGLTHALQSYGQRLREQQGRAGPLIEVESDIWGIPLPDYLALPLYRIAQEGIRNAVHHAEAQHLSLYLKRHDGELMLMIQDDGQGFHVPSQMTELMRAQHFGLMGLAERVEEIGGQLTLRSVPGVGTTLVVRVPFEAEKGEYRG